MRQADLSGRSAQICPLCSAVVEPCSRYPDYLCDACADLAVDEQGRGLAFFNRARPGDTLARYRDDGAARDSERCFVNAIACYASEAYFGGIVIRPDNRHKTAFMLRPCFGSSDRLIEFSGSADSVAIADLLSEALNARLQDDAETQQQVLAALAGGERLSFWRYQQGVYLLNDDDGGCFILAYDNNRQIMTDIAQALQASDRFYPLAVDEALYR